MSNAVDLRLTLERDDNTEGRGGGTEIFGSDKFAGDGDYAVEAEQRWGDTDAWRESQRRTATYTKDDWIKIKQETDAGMQAMAELMRSGRPATGAEARDEAEVARQLLNRWFYDCSPEFHRCLGEMYVADDRFRKTYDEAAPGLAQYVRDAIVANAEARRA